MRQTDRQLAQLNGLTNNQFRAKYKIGSKHKKRVDKYPEPIITAENRDIWEKKILNKNPWLIDYNHSYKQPESYEVVEDFTSPDNISWEDYQHMQSIKQEIRQ